MNHKQQLLKEAKSLIGEDKDEIIDFLLAVIIKLGGGVSMGYIRKSANPDTRPPKEPLDPLSN